MDIGLPDIDGMVVTEGIRQIEKAHDQRHSHIVALTAYLLEEVWDKCLAAGMNEVLTKPIDLETLKNLVHEYL